jgi:hypothetical protein
MANHLKGAGFVRLAGNPFAPIALALVVGLTVVDLTRAASPAGKVAPTRMAAAPVRHAAKKAAGAQPGKARAAKHGCGCGSALVDGSSESAKMAQPDCPTPPCGDRTPPALAGTE